MSKYIFYIQGVYFFITGIWPILSITTFQFVTGPKTDLWLVKTVGVLITAVGIGLVIAGARDSLSPEIIAVAVGCAIAFICVDIIYVVKKVIIWVYLLDALAELIFLIAWVIIIIQL